jgi:mannosyltransferase OCH1-like enzyme
MYVDYQASDRKSKLAVSIYLAITIPTMLAILLGLGGQLQFNLNRLAIGGVPLPIVIDFLKDDTARNAYFQGNKNLLHDRLSQMGVEEQIKDFYRSQIDSEQEIDRHIHQIFYDNTGYVGEAYRVNSEGSLKLKY